MDERAEEEKNTRRNKSMGMEGTDEIIAGSNGGGMEGGRKGMSAWVSEHNLTYVSKNDSILGWRHLDASLGKKHKWIIQDTH